MSNVQYVAIGVAALLVVALIVTLIVTRRRHTWEGEPVDEELFLAQPPPTRSRSWASQSDRWRT